MSVDQLYPSRGRPAATIVNHILNYLYIFYIYIYIHTHTIKVTQQFRRLGIGLPHLVIFTRPARELGHNNGWGTLSETLDTPALDQARHTSEACTLV